MQRFLLILLSVFILSGCSIIRPPVDNPRFIPPLICKQPVLFDLSDNLPACTDESNPCRCSQGFRWDEDENIQYKIMRSTVTSEGLTEQKLVGITPHRYWYFGYDFPFAVTRTTYEYEVIGCTAKDECNTSLLKVRQIAISYACFDCNHPEANQACEYRCHVGDTLLSE